MPGMMTLAAVLAALVHPIATARATFPTPDPAAVAVIDDAIARMGGTEALRGIERVRLETMTLWQTPSFDGRPYADMPSVEHHFELRDYTIPAWRNTRRSLPFPGRWMEITDLVRDSVAIRDMGRGWAPLNVAYVDEMRELFTFAPERVLLLAREAPDLRLLGDTAIDALPHARIAATIGGFPSILLFRKSDGLPAMVGYRAAQPNDFILAALGEMEVEIWFSRWWTFPGGITVPLQRDVRRIGRPYKRMTVVSATFDPPAEPDSFAIGDSLRAAFFATANRPMYDFPLDSARIVEGRFAEFRAAGAPAGAVKVGDAWLLVETGAAALNAERALEWLRGADPSARLAGAIVTMPVRGNGGVVALADRKVPMHVGAGADPFVRMVLRNHGRKAEGLDLVSEGRWIRIADDSVRLEPVDLPNLRGATLIYVPSLRWLYASFAFMPIDVEVALAHARARGWPVERFGSFRGVLQPVPKT